MEGDFFYQAFIYLGAAVVAVPLAKKLGLGSVLGYLIAGVLIGPFVLGFVGEEGQDIMHFAEFGVVMMLFLVGLELQPSLLWKLRKSILGLGGMQVGITAIIISAVALMFTDLAWQTALAVGLTLALSSTAIVIQTLNEKGLMKTEGGQNAFSVLLFQDIAVIPILAFFPMLAVFELQHIDSGHHEELWLNSLPIIWRTLVMLGGIASIIFGGKYLIGPAFRLIAQTRLRELFTVAALLLVIGITLLMTQMGLSPALGTFLAGVVLAQSEYRHQLETDIEPFKGLLLGLFFIAVGASIDFKLIGSSPATIAMLVFGLILIKLIVLFVIGKVFGMRMDNNMLFSFGLAQGGEFAFVLVSFGLQNGVMDAATADPLIAAVAISMALTPLLMMVNEKFIQPNFGTKEEDDREADVVDVQNNIIIAGFGRYGSMIGRFLQANGQQATYLDIDPNNVDLLRKLGFKVFYGDASRHDLLHAAGAEDAKLLIVTVDVPEKAIEIVKTAKEHFPHLKIISRARSWSNYSDLIDAGITNIYREYLESSLRMAADALACSGFRAYQVERAVKKFKRHDERLLRELSSQKHEDGSFLRGGKRNIEELERMMLEDMENDAKDKDLGWDVGSVKEEYAKFFKAHFDTDTPSNFSKRYKGDE
ncbi:monovalent cation:proton antiporter-2 (CPA2) family protein [Saccharicrinis aurantiacus]|uniref:monovalent cation:proton antiporter-2 (CPA2) family protein n=1 Tax=Saccharicrinis aurantiacus TaxID=1849719 RepID=UPI00094FD755|nr:monovalent cation:proton antiporter-2 (CPA2) family protein [Saccharicrinis aurantiacus]